MNEQSRSGPEWRRRISREAVGDEFPAEGREWLPMVLAGLFLAAILAALVFLFLDSVAEEDLSPQEALRIAEKEAQLPTPRSTSEERSRWEAALEADTVLGYRRFMEDFPESVYLGQAQVQLGVLDDRAWEAFAAEDTASAYQDYLAEFPDGLHQSEAMQRLDAIRARDARLERETTERQRADNQAWEAARASGTLTAIDRYIRDWPAGLHIAEAEAISKRLRSKAEDDRAFETARSLGTSDAYQAYIDAFPQGSHVTEALAAMDDLVMRPGRQFRDCENCPLIVVVPAGSFVQGSGEDSAAALAMEQPAHPVTIPEVIGVGVHEVTMAQWDACVEDGGCDTRPEDNGWGRAGRPVIMVSWDETQQYLKWLSDRTGERYRLPSESEWEYFARAGEEGDWLGGGPEAVCAFGNIAGSESGFDWKHPDCADPVPVGTAPTGSFQPNAFGLHDVIGNVAEWTADCMNLSYLDAPGDGSAWTRGMCGSHITRGGSWLTGSREIRLPARFNLKNGDRNDFTGFRVVREIDER